MTITEKVQSILEADAAVAALVPAARMRTPGDNQGLALPYIVHFPVGLDQQYTYTGLRSVRYWDYYQISIFADSLGSAEPIFAAVRGALAGNHDGTYIWIQPGAGYVGEERSAGGVSVHQFSMDLRIRESL